MGCLYTCNCIFLHFNFAAFTYKGPKYFSHHYFQIIPIRGDAKVLLRFCPFFWLYTICEIINQHQSVGLLEFAKMSDCDLLHDRPLSLRGHIKVQSSNYLPAMILLSIVAFSFYCVVNGKAQPSISLHSEQ